MPRDDTPRSPAGNESPSVRIEPAARKRPASAGRATGPRAGKASTTAKPKTKQKAATKKKRAATTKAVPKKSVKKKQSVAKPATAKKPTAAKKTATSKKKAVKKVVKKVAKKTAKKVVAKRTASKQPAARPKPATSKKATAKRTVAKKVNAKQVAAKKTASTQAAARPPVPERATSKPTPPKPIPSEREAAPERKTAPESRAPAGDGRGESGETGRQGSSSRSRRTRRDARRTDRPRRRRRSSEGQRPYEPRPRRPEPRGETIPPLPDDDDEIVPFTGTEDTSAPSREAPAHATPLEILEGVRKGTLHVSALARIADEDVTRLAAEARMPARAGERRSDTLYRLLQEQPQREKRTTTYVEGLLEMHPDGYGFLRRAERNYTQHPDDVYVGAGLIRKFGLKPGHWISGQARPSRPGEPMLALHRVEEVNHEDLETLREQMPFENLTVVYPDQRFLLEVEPEDYEMRVMDLFCPLGRGQRALVVSPPRAGKTVILQKLADSIAHNSPNVDIVVLLVDERPEEVTNMRRSVRGEVIASTFDKPVANHVRIAELVMEKVKRMVEFGRHVVLLLDSITRLGRAYNNVAGPSGRILTGGLEAKALTRPKRFFGAARNIEDGGSLTIVATALVDTGSRMDEVIFEEFKGSGNMEVVLDRELANARIWPAINLPASGTRNEDLLLHPEELRRVNILRRAMQGRDPQSVMESMREQLEQHKTNAELLMGIG